MGFQKLSQLASPPLAAGAAARRGVVELVARASLRCPGLAAFPTDGRACAGIATEVVTSVFVVFVGHRLAGIRQTRILRHTRSLQQRPSLGLIYT